MNIELPALQLHPSYILPISKKEYGICGLGHFEQGCYENVRFIDSLGQEWLIEGIEKTKFKNWFQYLLLNKSKRSIRVSFKLKEGAKYSLWELRNEIEIFLMSKQLSGAPFASKTKEVKEYLDNFKTVSSLISDVGYFDARRNT